MTSNFLEEGVEARTALRGKVEELGSEREEGVGGGELDEVEFGKLVESIGEFEQLDEICAAGHDGGVKVVFMDGLGIRNVVKICFPEAEKKKNN